MPQQSARQWLTVKVVARRAEAQDIVSFELADPQGRSLPPFSAGAHLDVEVQDGLIRQYSLCNHPIDRHRYRIAVLKDPNGRGGSLALHDHVHEGDLLHVSTPRNHFRLAPAAKRSLLFAGGIGVTPLLCMAERLAHIAADFELHYCARSLERMAFVEQIKQSSFASRVHFHLDNGPPSQQLDHDKVLATPEPGTHLYVCGPAGFMNRILQTAQQHGWQDEQLHREYFAAATHRPTLSDGELEVQIASTGISYVIPAHQSITQALRQQGVDIPTSCEEGVCGTCLTRVLEGEPDHHDLFFSEQERAMNNQILPCCSRAKSRKLVFDL